MDINNTSSSSGDAEGVQNRDERNQETNTLQNQVGTLLGITNKNSGIISFSHNISVRLDGNNYLLWKQQITTAIYGYGLEKHLVEDQIPPMFKTLQDEATASLNPDFVTWRRQDQLMMSWLLASMSEGMLTRVVGCNYAFEI